MDVVYHSSTASSSTPGYPRGLWAAGVSDCSTKTSVTYCFRYPVPIPGYQGTLAIMVAEA
eukprot:1207591-Rhodomonas_salina.1